MGAVSRKVSADWSEDFSLPIPASFRLQSGDALADGVVRVRRFGAADAPPIIALGGISSGRDVCSEQGWWRGFAGAGAGGLDTTRFAVLGVDFAPLGDQRVRITPHDQARLLIIALDHLNIERLHALVGASYGGMVGLALAALAPERLARLCVISAAHRPAALALAWRGVQRRTVEFALAHGDGAAGLSLARQLAMITYRTGAEFEARFGAGVDAEGRGAVDHYLASRGEAFAGATPPQRWLSLSEAIDRFSVEPEAVSAPTLVVACPSDQLAPFADMQELARRLPNLQRFETLPSLYGHDAFLKEPALAGILRTFLEGPANE